MISTVKGAKQQTGYTNDKDLFTFYKQFNIQ